MTSGGTTSEGGGAEEVARRPAPRLVFELSASQVVGLWREKPDVDSQDRPLLGTVLRGGVDTLPETSGRPSRLLSRREAATSIEEHSRDRGRCLPRSGKCRGAATFRGATT